MEHSKTKNDTNHKAKSDVPQVDEELYSRQLYVMGHDAMRKLMVAKVLVIGMNGLGQEIAKNICLAGVKQVAIFDKSPVTPRDLCAGFYFSKRDIGRPKDESALPHLARLNRHVVVQVVPEVRIPVWDLVVLANQSLSDCINIGEISHAHKVKLVIANVSGLFSQIFVDFVDHTCTDKYGLPLCSGSINDVAPDGTLTIAEGSKHTLEDGDLVTVYGKTYKVTVKSKTEFCLQGYSADIVRVGGDFEQVRDPQQMTFKSLKEASSDHSTIVSFDNPALSLTIHNLFFSEESPTDSPTCSNSQVSESKKNKIASSKADHDLIEQFHLTRGCLIAPMCSIIGGFAAQEIIKGISGKFLPLKQFLYFELATGFFNLYGESVTSDNTNISSSSNTSNIDKRYEDMIRIFGEEAFKKLQSLNIFLVGAGAIGCENIKNIVMSGLGTEGALHVTDMDSIEPSNLNRQFLFHEENIGQLKAEAAIKRACELNEDYSSGGCELKAYNTPVGSTSEDVFTDEFIARMSVISNALDNVEARNYMDMRCVALRKPMIDAGTLGTKGHVQVVLPFKTESYRSTVDSSEASVPMCTIKTFPTAIEHAIEWALEIFRRKFNEEPGVIIEYLKGESRVQGEDKGGEDKSNKADNNEETRNNTEMNSAAPNNDNTDKLENMDVLEKEDQTPEELYEEIPRNVEGCIKNGLDLFVQLFSTSIQRLLTTFPADYVTKEGFPFWSPPKRPPSPVAFNINDKQHILFVETAANLFAVCYNVRKITRGEVLKYLQNLLSLKEPNPISFGDADVDLSVVRQLEFEKDSWHADFIYACSNLRARNYGIREKSRHFIRGIAGKIIPAIATTTAVVSGLAIMEMIKACLLVNQKELASRNFFLDLAMPFLVPVECTPAPKMSYTSNGETREYTLWSRMEFPDMTLRELIENVKERLGDTICMASIGKKIIYWDFNKKYDDNLDKRISELCERKAGQLVQYVDVMSENDIECESVVVLF